jgi:hypothetical protein
MAATYIPALVIKHNNSVFLTPDLSVGVTMPIPTPGAGGRIDGDYWAVPISNYGIVTGFNYEPTTPDDTEPPTLQSFHVFRLVTDFGNDVWIVRGSSTFDGESPANAGYIQSSQDAECCADTPATLPTDVPALVPCQTACEFNADNNYFFILAIPTDTGTLTATGYLNGEALSPASGANAAALLISLNSLWTNQGSPQIAITWTLANENTTAIGVITAGSGEDVLCARVTSA